MAYIFVDEQLVLFDDEDITIVNSCGWYIDNQGYVVSNVRPSQSMHVLICPNENRHPIIDHINHDKLDNRKVNLRATSFNVNSRNRTKAKTSYAKTNADGSIVYRAHVSINNKSFHLGTFRTKRRADIVAIYNTKRLICGLPAIALKRASGKKKLMRVLQHL